MLGENGNHGTVITSLGTVNVGSRSGFKRLTKYSIVPSERSSIVAVPVTLEAMGGTSCPPLSVTLMALPTADCNERSVKNDVRAAEVFMVVSCLKK